MTSERPSTPRDLGRIEGTLTQVCDQLDDISKILGGNGQPGIIDRLTRVEEQLKRSGDASADNGVAIQGLHTALDLTSEGLKTNLALLTKMVEDHHKDQSLHSLKMVLNKETLWWIVVLFIVFHTIVENGGQVYQWILKMFGL